MAAAPAIATRELTKHFGDTRALNDLTLDVEPGEVFGFLGPNGAGKSTTIRLLLDVIRPTAGSARVLGIDPNRNGVEVRARIGYLPGDFLVDGRHTAEDFLDHLAAVRGGVDPAYRRELVDRLDVEVGRPIRQLSKGNRQKVGVVQALMHQPDLLILDEPTSGLDPLLQQTFLDLVREARQRGQTVFMSSHVLSEIEAVADRVAIIRRGDLVALEALEDLRSRATRRVVVSFGDHVDVATVDGLPSLARRQLTNRRLEAVLDGPIDPLIKALARHSVESLTADEPNLDEIFHEYYAGEEEVPVR